MLYHKVVCLTVSASPKRSHFLPLCIFTSKNKELFRKLVYLFVSIAADTIAISRKDARRIFILIYYFQISANHLSKTRIFSHIRLNNIQEHNHLHTPRGKVGSELAHFIPTPAHFGHPVSSFL